jgi:hypothetical protein
VPSLILVLICLFVGVPATIALTPDQHTTVAGQELAVGARLPSLSWTGPAQLRQIGNTELDIVPLQIKGPLRPRITLGPVQRNAAAVAAFDPANGDPRANATNQIKVAFIAWYAWAALILLAITIALVTTAGYLRMLVTLRRQSRATDETLTIAQLWHRGHTQIRAMGIAALATTLVAWAACGVLAYSGTVDGLKHVRSLVDLVGTYYAAPNPVGPTVEGYTGAVIGDSRAARAGGTVISEPTPEDSACSRTVDSLAAEITGLALVPVKNLACSGASIANGLRGPQTAGGQVVPPQVGLLKQMQGLKFVVVVIGPNDLGWSDQLRYCYGVTDCQDRLTEGEFTYRLAAFDRNYGDLLHDLNDLPGAPQVIVMSSYDIFAPEASCPDARGPVGAVGLSEQNIALLINRNQQFNDVLAAGAEKYSFSVAKPALTPLCGQPSDSLGPDIQGLGDPAPFHPTAIGMLRLASSVVRLLGAPVTAPK